MIRQISNIKRDTLLLTLAMPVAATQAGEFTTWGNDQGLDIFFDYSSEVMSNVSGGERSGTGYNGLASFGLEADLGQPLGWEGTSLKLSGMDLHGSGIGSRVGDMMGVSNIEGYGSVRLYESWVEKLLKPSHSASGPVCFLRTKSSPRSTRPARSSTRPSVGRNSSR